MRRSLRNLIIALALPLSAVAAPATDELVARGEYLARAGNCMGCHTARGGAEFAGGRRLGSEFGTFITPNITPDPETGIGAWSELEFQRALGRGRRADGRPLYPACPYPSFTRATAADVGAIYAYLRSVPPVRQRQPDHELGLLASQRSLLEVWQWLFFEPGEFTPDPARDAQWNRGAYLVQGLGHCMACHSARNRFGATRAGSDVPGSRIQGWYAPSLHARAEAGLQPWSAEQGVALLRHGQSAAGSVLGPMADVVFDSLQHLSEADVAAMVSYLRSLPEHEPEPPRRLPQLPAARLEAVQQRGGKLYQRHCMDCHGRAGEGSVAASALAGNRAVQLGDPTNVINAIRFGGYPPSTEGNPRPFGMPPFGHLSAAEIAAVATYIRTSWGNDGTPVATATVERLRWPP